jgi:hypothetical protein
MGTLRNIDDLINSIENDQYTSQEDPAFSMSGMGGSTFAKVSAVTLGIGALISMCFIGKGAEISLEAIAFTAGFGLATLGAIKYGGIFPKQEENQPEPEKVEEDCTRDNLVQLYSGDVEQVFAKTVNSGKEAQVISLHTEGQERPINLWVPAYKG